MNHFGKIKQPNCECSKDIFWISQNSRIKNLIHPQIKSINSAERFK
jgi:hypothetical protein